MTDSDEEEDTSNPAVHFDTCVQNADGPALEFDIAPGEGQRPIIFFRDEKSEVMSFPKEFPKGRFGYNTPRDTKLSIKKYFNTRLSVVIKDLLTIHHIYSMHSMLQRLHKFYRP